jgi:hypothetical protein
MSIWNFLLPGQGSKPLVRATGPGNETEGAMTEKEHAAWLKWMPFGGDPEPTRPQLAAMARGLTHAQHIDECMGRLTDHYEAAEAAKRKGR